MSSVKPAGSSSSAAIAQQPATTSNPKSPDTNSTSGNSSTPTAKETKSSQQLATAKKEEFELTNISKTLNNTLEQQSAKMLGKFPTAVITSLTGAPTSFSAEDIFHKCEKGHEEPGTVIKLAEEADKIVGKNYQDLINAIPNSSLPSTISSDSDQTSNINSHGQDTVSVLNGAFAGTTIGRRFANTPPIFTTVPRSYFEASQSANGVGGGAEAEYISGSNQILIASDITTNEADLKRTVLHEQLHYASYLGGGDPSNMRWRDDKGNPILNGSKDSAKWLHEGLTELQAQQFTKGMGLKATYSSYPKELRVAFFMEKAVGDKKVVRDAFLSGNFTEVRKRMNSTLSDGSFDRMMAASGPVDALMTLTNEMDKAGIDTKQLLEDPIFKIAREKHTITK